MFETGPFFLLSALRGASPTPSGSWVSLARSVARTVSGTDSSFVSSSGFAILESVPDTVRTIAPFRLTQDREVRPCQAGE